MVFSWESFYGRDRMGMGCAELVLMIRGPRRKGGFI